MFADAFDIYLEVIRVIDDRVKEALGQDGPDWRVLNACPACSYEVCNNQFLVLFSTTKHLDSLRMSLSSSSDGCMPLMATIH